MEKRYSLIEVANILGMKPRTMRQWVHDGKMQASKIQGTDRWAVKESEVKRLLGEEKKNDG